MITLRAISLGWGVQSWTLAAMAALGEPNRAVEKVTTQWTDIPAFTATPNSRGGGQLRRQCTQRWKVHPIRRALTQELERQSIRKAPGCVQSLQGISLDEFHRMKESDVLWIVNRYPLVEMKMTRADCMNWLTAHGLPTPPKSACVFCPFQNRRRWQELKREDRDDWNHAVEIDEAIRKVRPPYDLFVHPSRIALVDAVPIAEDSGMEQLSLIDEDAAGCDSGYCFV